MIIHKRSVCIVFIVIGLVMALGNGYLLLSGYGLWQGLMFLVGLGWIWLGGSNLRRLQNTEPK